MKTKEAFTHKITYSFFKKDGKKAQASFPVTSKGVKIHLAEMQKGNLCFDIKVETLKKP